MHPMSLFGFPRPGRASATRKPTRPRAACSCLLFAFLALPVAAAPLQASGPVLPSPPLVASPSDREPSDREPSAREPSARDREANLKVNDGMLIGACRCFQGGCPHCSQRRREAIQSQVASAYKGVFYDNDFSYIDDPYYRQHFWGDRLKGIDLPHDGKLDVSGEFRLRYHDERNFRGPNGITGVDDLFWLTRYRHAGNYRATSWLRLYTEFLYADPAGEQTTPLGIEENHGDLRNLFADIRLLETGTGELFLRSGRQEMLYGSQRLISPLDWSNTRRTFDGFKLSYRGADWNVDGFFLNPVANDVKGFDERRDAVDFWGVYASRKGWEIGTVDTYFLSLENDQVGFRYDTLGARISGQRSGLLYAFEGGVQFGDNAHGTAHDAGFVTAGLGRHLNFGGNDK